MLDFDTILSSEDVVVVDYVVDDGVVSTAMDKEAVDPIAATEDSDSVAILHSSIPGTHTRTRKVFFGLVGS